MEKMKALYIAPQTYSHPSMMANTPFMASEPEEEELKIKYDETDFTEDALSSEAHFDSSLWD